MRWLQWATIDLEKGMAGVETHARSLARELQKLGVETGFSSDPQELNNPKWDVIHTHGSLGFDWNTLKPRPRKRKTTFAYTLHGSVLGRMKACREWKWAGGYLAASKEILTFSRSDVIFTVHPDVALFQLAKKIGKTCTVCLNGWDSAAQPDPIPEELVKRLSSLAPYFVFLGRGNDPMKGVDRLKIALSLAPELHLVAAPGEGFEKMAKVSKTGRLSSSQVHQLLKLSQGLVIPSRYEGNSLALLEALSQGVQVIATPVGGVNILPEGIRGLIEIKKPTPEDIAEAMRLAVNTPSNESIRQSRAQINQKLLPTWAHVAKTCLEAVKEHRNKF